MPANSCPEGKGLAASVCLGDWAWGDRRNLRMLNAHLLHSPLFVWYPPWILGFPGGASGKEPAFQCRRHKRFRFDPWVRKICWRRAWQPTPAFLPRQFHGQRSLAGCSPWGRKELDATETTEHVCVHAPWVLPGPSPDSEIQGSCRWC